GKPEIEGEFELAESYKLAGDCLVDAALSSDKASELAFPVIYNYRHAIELYLKAIINPDRRNHDLAVLMQKFKVFLKKEFQADTPEWFDGIVCDLHTFDPDSTSFRYGRSDALSSYAELWVDLPHIKRLMGWLANSCQRIRLRLWEK